jgi:hypothetical protein
VVVKFQVVVVIFVCIHGHFEHACHQPCVYGSWRITELLTDNSSCCICNLVVVQH